MGLFSKKKKILVIEDETDIAENLKARLELEGFSVDIASDGKMGVEKTRAQRPDLVVLDVMLPLVDGYEVCKLIKSDDRTKKTQVLMLTALPHLEDAEKAFSVGANDFLNKPYTNDRLLAKISKLLNPEEPTSDR